MALRACFSLSKLLFFKLKDLLNVMALRACFSLSKDIFSYSKALQDCFFDKMALESII
jgi:hypothetical protein